MKLLKTAKTPKAEIEKALDVMVKRFPKVKPKDVETVCRAMIARIEEDKPKR